MNLPKIMSIDDEAIEVLIMINYVEIVSSYIANETVGKENNEAIKSTLKLHLFRGIISTFGYSNLRTKIIP